MRFIRRRWWWLLLPALALGWWLHARQGAGADIVFISSRRGRYEIYRMHDDGTNVRRLIANPECSDPTVNPNGKHLAYVRDDGHIWVADIDGANSRQVTRGQGYRYDPALFPDGQTLIYSAYLGYGICHLYRINLDGTGMR